MTFVGKHFGSGELVKNGEGILNINSSGEYKNRIRINGGAIYIQNGAQVTSGTPSTGGLYIAQDPSSSASLVVKGQGTVLNVMRNIMTLASGVDSVGTIRVESGAVFTADNSLTMAQVNGSQGYLVVTGKGSSFSPKSFTIQDGEGFVTVADGGQIVNDGLVLVGGKNKLMKGTGSGSILVTGAGSKWATANTYYLMEGDLSVSDGGLVQASQLLIGTLKDGTAVTTVSGQDSALVNLDSGSSDLQLGTAGTGTLTVKNGGKVRTGNGTGAIKVATSATGKGTLNIGGAEGEAAAAAGALEASAIQFGAGAGALNFNHIEKDYVFDVAVKGKGTISQIGSGRTSFNGDQTAFIGVTNVKNGILSVNGTLGGTMNVLGGRLQGIGTVGSTVLDADGIIAPGNSIGTLTINGNLEGKGGLVEIETVLGDDNSQTDRLVVTGDTSGTANVRVINRDGEGAPTVEGIKIIEVGGQSDGVFSLKGDYPINGQQVVVSGAYAYRLVKNGVTDPTDGDWYLRSELKPKEPEVPVTPVDPGNTPPAEPSHDPEPAKPLYQAGAPLYEVYPQVLQELNALPTLQQRVGNRYWTGESGEGVVIDGNSSVWGRVEGAHNRLDVRRTTTGTSHETDIWKLQAGIDGQFYESEAGGLIGSITGHYGKASADVTSVYGAGTIDTDAYGVGGTLTWYGDNGFYVDGQGQATWFDSDLFSDIAAQGLANGNKGFGYAFSLETGKRTAIAPGWTLTPQAQLVYSSVDFDSFNDGFDARIRLRSGDSLIGRLGLSADSEERWQGRDGLASRASVYGIANLYYDFLNGTKVNLAGLDFVNDNDPLWGGIGLGGTYDWAAGRYALYGETLLKTSLSHPGDSFGVNGTVGLKVSF
ncbi:autotransporter outer membrane beta-barrel domain-containing protein [Brucella anthropi]|uniref:autotransporter family protein n=1 Tax=Brucella anthropi TaxID=529 RepID=UPI003986E398